MPRTRKRKNKKLKGGSTKIIREGNNTFTINNKCDGDNSTTIIPECMGPMAVFPAPMLEPFPELAPQPAPQPAPELAPQPAPQPAPELAPQPAPEPFPESAPQPASEPFPESAPQPAPEPGQEPFPEPAPQPAKLYTYNISLGLFSHVWQPNLATYDYDRANGKIYSIEFATRERNTENLSRFNINDIVNVNFTQGVFQGNTTSGPWPRLPLRNYLNRPAKIINKYNYDYYNDPIGTSIRLEYTPPIEIQELYPVNPVQGNYHFIFDTSTPIIGTISKQFTTSIPPPAPPPVPPAPKPAPAPVPQPVPEPAPEPAPAPDNPDLIRLTVIEFNNLYDSSLFTRRSLEYSGSGSMKTVNFIRLNILEDITNVNINDIVTFNNVNLTIRYDFNDSVVATTTLNGTAKVIDKNINGNSLGLEYISGNFLINIPLSNLMIQEVINSSYASGTITVDLLLRTPMPAPAPHIELVMTIESTSTSIIAGDKVGRFSGDEDNALSASLNKPFGLVYDINNNLYIADSVNQRIRKISTSGIITTIAGNGNQGNSGDGGDALLASFNFPTDLQIKDNDLYILDTNNNAIRVMNLDTKIITKFIDNTYTPNPDLFQPQSFRFDYDKNFLYLANTFRNKIIKIDVSTKEVTLVAGDGSPGYLDNVLALSSKLNTPYGIELDSHGNIYIADTRNNRIRFIYNINNKIYTIAGNGFPGFFGDSGKPLSARLYNPTNIIVDQNYNIIFSDSGNNRIRKIFLNGTPNPNLSVFPEVTTADMAQFYTNGVFNTWPWRGRAYSLYWGEATQLFNKKVWLTIAGNMPLFGLMNDSNQEGRKDIDAFRKRQDALEQAAINRYYAIATIAGTGTISYTPDNIDARQTSINNPTKLLFNNNDLIFSDTNNHVIRKITPLPAVGGRRKYKKKKLFTRRKKLNKKKSNQKKFQ